MRERRREMREDPLEPRRLSHPCHSARLSYMLVQRSDTLAADSTAFGVAEHAAYPPRSAPFSILRAL